MSSVKKFRINCETWNYVYSLTTGHNNVTIDFVYCEPIRTDFYLNHYCASVHRIFLLENLVCIKYSSDQTFVSVYLEQLILTAD